MYIGDIFPAFGLALIKLHATSRVFYITRRYVGQAIDSLIDERVPKGPHLHLHFNAELNQERLFQEAQKRFNIYVEVTAGGTSPPDNTTLPIQDAKVLSLSDRKRLTDLYRWARRGGAPGHTERYIPVSANGIRLEAFPDTGSELDIISHSLSTQLNLKLNKTQARTIQTPTGRKIQTLGTAELNIAF